MRRLEHQSCFVIPFMVLLTACSNSSATPASPLSIQYTLASQPWLADVEACAGERTILPELSAPGFQDLGRVDMAIRIGEDALPSSPAYQVGSEEIVVILNPGNNLSELTTFEVSALFSGGIQDWQELGGSPAAVQAWVFSPGEDLQRLFVGSTLGSLPVTSQARLATSPEEMITAIREDVNAVGILTRRWMSDGVKALYSAGEFPVLVLLQEEPDAGMEAVVDCLQKLGR